MTKPAPTEKEMEKALKEFFAIRQKLSDANDQLAAKLKPFHDAHAAKIQPMYARVNELRELILSATFPKAKEGTESVIYKSVTIKCVTKISRSVDKAVVASVGMLAKFRAMGIPVENLVRWSPDLELKEYRKLTPQQRKTFDLALTIKDPVKTLEIEGTL